MGKVQLSYRGTKTCTLEPRGSYRGYSVCNTEPGNTPYGMYPGGDGGRGDGDGERVMRTQYSKPSNDSSSRPLCSTCSIYDLEFMLLLLLCQPHLLPTHFFPLCSLLFTSSFSFIWPIDSFAPRPFPIPSWPVLAVLLYPPPRKPRPDLPDASVFPSVCP